MQYGDFPKLYAELSAIRAAPLFLLFVFSLEGEEKQSMKPMSVGIMLCSLAPQGIILISEENIVL